MKKRKNGYLKPANQQRQPNEQFLWRSNYWLSKRLDWPARDDLRAIRSSDPALGLKIRGLPSWRF
jgi:hypothetical protein